MKRLTLIILGLCLCTALYADMNPYIIGSGGGSAGGGESTTVTWGLYELADFVPDSRTGNTIITDSTLDGGGPTASWIGFYVTASGTGSGSALVTDWDDDTDTITCESGLTLENDATITVGCRYTTGLQDAYVSSQTTNLHKGSSTNLNCEYDTTNGYMQHPIIYFPVHTDISASSITSAHLYTRTGISYLSASCDVVAGKIVDGSVTPNTTMWQEQSDAFNQAATWEYKDDDTELDWEADSSNNFSDVYSAVQSAAVSQDTTDNVWRDYNITDIVEDWEIDGDTNLGVYLRNTTANDNIFSIFSKEDTTEQNRWIVKVIYE